MQIRKERKDRGGKGEKRIRRKNRLEKTGLEVKTKGNKVKEKKY